MITNFSFSGYKVYNGGSSGVNSFYSKGYTNISIQAFTSTYYTNEHCPSNNYCVLDDSLSLPSPTFTNLTVTDKKVYIHESCNFPPLLLSRANTSYKRVINPSKADKIIINDFINFSIARVGVAVIEEKTKQILFFGYTGAYNIQTLKEFLQKVKTIFSSNEIKVLYSVTEKESHLLELIDTYSNIVPQELFIKEVLKQLPKITKEESSELISLLTSKDEESIKVGYNMAQYLNFTDYIPDIIFKLSRCHEIYIPNISACEYVTHVLGFKKKEDLKDLYIMGSQQCYLYINELIMQNPYIDSSIKVHIIDKLVESLTELIQRDYQQSLSKIKYHVKLEKDDENGETVTNN